MNYTNHHKINLNLSERFSMEKNEKEYKTIDSFFKNLKNEGKNIESTIVLMDKFAESNPETKYITRNGSYILNNYHIVPGYFDKDSQFLNNIKLLNHYGFCKTSAPELVDIHYLPKEKFGVMAFKINDTKSAEMYPYLQAADSVLDEKKTKFIQEQFVLMNNLGKYNPAVLESYDSWLVTPDTKNIYIDTWSTLKDCKSPQEREFIKSEIKDRV